MPQTDEWRAERRTRLYHSCMDILVEQINALTEQNILFRFGDQMYRECRVFLDFLSMDGDEVSHATMCPTVQCPSCLCPRNQLDDTEESFPMRNTQEIYKEVASLRRQATTGLQNAGEHVAYMTYTTLYMTYTTLII